MSFRVKSTAIRVTILADGKQGFQLTRKVSYHDVYPGNDIIYDGNQKLLEFDFVVKPGADPSAILLKIGGSSIVAIDGSGSLVIDRGGSDDQGKLRIQSPGGLSGD